MRSENLPILVNYLGLACKGAGVYWNWENDGELSHIVAEVRAAARAEVAEDLLELERRINFLTDRIEDLERIHADESA